MEERSVRRAVEGASPYGDGGRVGIRPGDTSRVWIGARGGIRGCLPTAWRETISTFCHGFSFLHVRSKLHFFIPSFSPVSDVLDFCQVRGQFSLER